MAKSYNHGTMERHHSWINQEETDSSMLPFTRKKGYINRCIREMTMEPRALAPVAEITIIMIVLVMLTTRSTMPVGQGGKTTI